MAALARALAASSQITKNAAAKVIILDIERMKGSAEVEFWDLSDFKNRRIHADDVTAWPRTICLAWKPYGATRRAARFAAEWEPGGTDVMLRAAWDAYDQADIIVGHNIDNFDTKKLRAAWAEIGLRAPSPYKSVDTLKVARTVFGFESNTLDALCTRLDVQAKTDRYDVETARAACDGNQAAQRRIKSYNIGDTFASEALFDRMRGWIPNHPHVVVNSEHLTCNQCGGTDLERNGTYLANVMEYAAYRCRNCGGNVRAGHVRRVARTRGVQ